MVDTILYIWLGCSIIIFLFCLHEVGIIFVTIGKLYDIQNKNRKIIH